MTLEVKNKEWGTMAQFLASSDRSVSDDASIWQNLKYAISASSGFQRWQLERHTQLQGLRLDQQVQKYLRETLETLAY
ncbi:hypothetical protein B6N60_00435 [Richelia sinica FACHB-800]|uniref:Uncharacterized protein n=2 Tax=Richelia TaxID=98443 RepID=A0A975T426_9NOST|nr:hypothetical protein B6N60_00435 [Richelia sinica FACHB-800]